MSYIDAHVHVWTDDYDRYPFRVDTDGPPAALHVFEPEDILRHAKPCGVDRIVLVQMSYYWSDNQYMRSVMDTYPETFAGIGIVDPAGSHPEEEMERLAENGIRGFRIAPWGAPPETWLDTDAYAGMFATAAEHDLALCALVEPDALPALARRCTEFPRARVIIDHLCRIGANGPIEPAAVAALCGMARYPNVMVKISAFYALGLREPPYTDLIPVIHAVYEAFGAERLTWGSDSPYQVQAPHSYEEGLALVRDRLDFLSSSAKERILEGTAAEVFFPDAAANRSNR